MRRLGRFLGVVVLACALGTHAVAGNNQFPNYGAAIGHLAQDFVRHFEVGAYSKVSVALFRDRDTRTACKWLSRNMQQRLYHELTRRGQRLGLRVLTASSANLTELVAYGEWEMPSPDSELVRLWLVFGSWSHADGTERHEYVSPDVAFERGSLSEKERRCLYEYVSGNKWDLTVPRGVALFDAPHEGSSEVTRTRADEIVTLVGYLKGKNEKWWVVEHPTKSVLFGPLFAVNLVTVYFQPAGSNDTPRSCHGRKRILSQWKVGVLATVRNMVNLFVMRMAPKTGFSLTPSLAAGHLTLSFKCGDVIEGENSGEIEEVILGYSYKLPNGLILEFGDSISLLLKAGEVLLSESIEGDAHYFARSMLRNIRKTLINTVQTHR